MIGTFLFRARVFLALCVVSVGFCLEVRQAYAQAASCSTLSATLRTLERNGDFRDAEGNSRAARRLAAELQDAESAYVRTGCNDRAKRGETLTGNCRALAREITSGRAEYATLSEQVQTGNAVAQQREAVLQEISRFGCGRGDSRATFNGGEERRGNVFDQLFGGFTQDSDDQFFNDDIIDDGLGQFGGFGGETTVRTVCVRVSDGYFWPISYSTLPGFVGNDAQQCQAQCPGSEVRLYYYNNPGQEPEQMVDLLGEPYTALPNAFRYRTEFDASTSCKVPANTGVVTVAGGGEYGQSRAVIDFQGENFPLPLRDPRGRSPVTTATAAVQPAEQGVFVNVPLPRRRPAGPGEAAVEQPVPVKTAEEDLRVVQFGDTTVRIVGPDTPYARPVEAAP